MAQPVKKATDFLTDVGGEMRKVTWPGGRQTTTSTLVVIVFSLVVSLYLFGVDALVNWLFSMLLG